MKSILYFIFFLIFTPIIHSQNNSNGEIDPLAHVLIFGDATRYYFYYDPIIDKSRKDILGKTFAGFRVCFKDYKTNICKEFTTMRKDSNINSDSNIMDDKVIYTGNGTIIDYNARMDEDKCYSFIDYMLNFDWWLTK